MHDIFAGVPPWVMYWVVQAWRENRLLGNSPYEKLYNGVATYLDAYNRVASDDAREAMDGKVLQDPQWTRYVATWKKLEVEARAEIVKTGKVMIAPNARIIKKQKLSKSAERAMKNAKLFGFSKEGWGSALAQLSSLLESMTEGWDASDSRHAIEAPMRRSVASMKDTIDMELPDAIDGGDGVLVKIDWDRGEVEEKVLRTVGDEDKMGLEFVMTGKILAPEQLKGDGIELRSDSEDYDTYTYYRGPREVWQAHNSRELEKKLLTLIKYM